MLSWRCLLLRPPLSQFLSFFSYFTDPVVLHLSTQRPQQVSPHLCGSSDFLFDRLHASTSPPHLFISSSVCMECSLPQGYFARLLVSGGLQVIPVDSLLWISCLSGILPECICSILCACLHVPDCKPDHSQTILILSAMSRVCCWLQTLSLTIPVCWWLHGSTWC